MSSLLFFLSVELVQALEKISKSCVIRWTQSKLQFIIKEISEVGTQVYGQLPIVCTTPEPCLDCNHLNPTPI
jgi:hypothetical protein